MAIPASGQITMGTIQSEWGGSNPISLNEYYSGSLPSGSTSSSVSPTVASLTNSTYNPGAKYVPAYTLYERTNGFKSQYALNYLSGSMGSASATWTTTVGRDVSGNAGSIPSSGAIQADHFRGTSAGSSANLLSYGFGLYQTSSTSATALGNATFFCWIQGHYGTNGVTGNNWTNVPFRWIDSAAKNGIPATRWYGSDNQSNNGASTSKASCIHDTFPTIGAVTRYLWTSNFSSAITMSGTWTLTIQR